MPSKNIPTKPKLYSQVKSEAKRKFDVYPSAYANGWLVREYKKRGGGYKTVSKADDGITKRSGGLSTWFREGWVDISRPKKGGGFEPCGRSDASSGKYPKCVPASKAAKMTPEQIRSAVSRKRKAESSQNREGKKPINVSTFAKGGKVLRDPKGGLTAAGRAHFNRTSGSNLKAGVKGAANTPEKMRRKGSFLTRFFTNPSGPMVKPNGKPSRLALSANAWGETVPKNRSDAAKLAAKGRRLLQRYKNTKRN